MGSAALGVSTFAQNFAAPATTATGATPEGVAIGDFNGDGILDMAVANSGDSTISVYLGNGTGGFAAATGSPITVGTNPYAIAVGDFNGDGKLDLAVANSNSSNVTVLLGNGTGGFTAATGSPFAVGSAPKSIAVGDFNNDGVLDLAVTNCNELSVSLLIGNGTGGFTTASGSPFFAVQNNPQSVAVGDFNGDGNLDVADRPCARFSSPLKSPTATDCGLLSRQTEIPERRCESASFVAE